MQMKLTIVIQGEGANIVLTPESDLDKKAIQLMPAGTSEAFVEPIAFTENKNGILRDTSAVNSLVIKIKS